MKESLLFLCLIFILSGCASAGNASGPARIKIADIDFDNVVTPEGEKLYCKKETVTGTHRKTMTCLTKAEMDDGRRDSEMYMMRMKASPEAGDGGG